MSNHYYMQDEESCGQFKQLGIFKNQSQKAKVNPYLRKQGHACLQKQIPAASDTSQTKAMGHFYKSKWFESRGPRVDFFFLAA